VLGDAKVMAFLATKDPARAKAFYGGVLGLRFKDPDGNALSLTRLSRPQR
jgi:catechol 2,3-dioxygenase-like lactoylglutathione lyase family enzyme